MIVRRVVEGATRRTRVQRVNDNALEYVILGLRMTALVAAFSLPWDVVALIWTADMRWAATAAFAAILGGVCGWIGFYTFGNEGWHREGPH